MIRGRSEFGLGRLLVVEPPAVGASVVMPPEFYAELDVQLLTAVDDTARWEALIAGTREVIDRPGRLAEVGFEQPGKHDCLTGALRARLLD